MVNISLKLVDMFLCNSNRVQIPMIDEILDLAIFVIFIH